MRYAEYLPSPRLRHVVERFWFLETDRHGTTDAVLPDGRMELVVHYRGAFWRRTFAGAPRSGDSSPQLVRQPASLLVGQMIAPVVLAPEEGTAVAAIRLRPAAARALLKFPVAEAAGCFFALELIFPSIADLKDQLAEAPDERCRLRLLEQWVLSAGCEPPQRDVDGAVRTILRSGGRISIDALALLTGSGVRQLERQFRDAVGLPPKTFSRIVRLQRALAAIRQGLALSEVAVACGYYDQAHMTRDFRQLAAMSPGVWQYHAGELAPLFVNPSSLPER